MKCNEKLLLEYRTKRYAILLRVSYGFDSRCGCHGGKIDLAEIQVMDNKEFEDIINSSALYYPLFFKKRYNCCNVLCYY